MTLSMAEDQGDGGAEFVGEIGEKLNSVEGELRHAVVHLSQLGFLAVDFLVLGHELFVALGELVGAFLGDQLLLGHLGRGAFDLGLQQLALALERVDAEFIDGQDSESDDAEQQQVEPPCLIEIRLDHDRDACHGRIGVVAVWHIFHLQGVLAGGQIGVGSPAAVGGHGNPILVKSLQPVFIERVVTPLEIQGREFNLEGFVALMQGDVFGR